MLHIFTLLGHTRLSLLKEHARIMPLECTNSRTCEGGSGQVLSLHILKFLPSELIYRFNLCLCFTGMISALRANFCFLVHLITCHEEKNKKKTSNLT